MTRIYMKLALAGGRCCSVRALHHGNRAAAAAYRTLDQYTLPAEY